MDAWRYAAIAKNLRCIAYELGEDELKIVRRYHRNRGVGVPEGEALPKGKCFTHISPPPGSEDYYASLGRAEKYAFLSSAYYAPILAPISRIEDFEHLSIKAIRARTYDIREFLRHLRIGEYSLIDFALSDESVEDYVEVDIRRFWRIYDEAGDAVGHYLSLKNPHTHGLAIVLGVPEK